MVDENGYECGCKTASVEFYITGEIDRLTWKGNGQNNNGNGGNNSDSPSDPSGGEDEENQNGPKTATIFVGESIDLSAKFHMPTECEANLSVKDESKSDGVSFDPNPITTGGIDGSASTSPIKGESTVTGEKAGRYEIVANESCPSDDTSDTDDGRSGCETDDDTVTLIVKEPKPTLTIEEVPDYVFSDADYWVPIKAKLSNIPEGFNKVVIEDMDVCLHRGGSEVYNADSSENQHVEWGMGNGTRSDGDPTFVNTDTAVRGSGSSSSNSNSNGTSDEEYTFQNQEFTFTVFVNNKEAMQDRSFENQHLFSQNQGDTVPEFELEAQVNLSHGKSNGNGQVTGNNGTSQNIVSENRENPSLFADRKVGPVLEPGEPTEENDVKFVDENSYEGTMNFGEVAIRHAESERIKGECIPLNDDVELESRRSVLEGNGSAQIDLSQFSNEKSFYYPESTPGGGVSCIEKNRTYPLQTLYTAKAIVNTSPAGNLPGPEFTDGGRMSGAMARINLADFDKHYIGEKVQAEAKVITGANFYISYGKNILGDIQAMDLSKDEMDVRIGKGERENPAENVRWVIGIDHINRTDSEFASAISTVFSFAVAYASVPTSYALTIAAGRQLWPIIEDQWDSLPKANASVRTETRAYRVKPNSADGTLTERDGREVVKRNSQEAIWGFPDEGDTTSGLFDTYIEHDTVGGDCCRIQHLYLTMEAI